MMDVSRSVAKCDEKERTLDSLWLPDDIIFYLLKYLSEHDSISFALSGVCKSFSIVYGERRKIDAPCSYSLGPELLNSFLTNWEWKEKITRLDFSHCYWLPETLMLPAISSLPELQELYIQDTKLTLFHCAQIFLSCRGILKLGISLVEENWRSIEKQLVACNSSSVTLYQSLSNGIGQLTHFKVLVYNRFSHYLRSWFVILPMLSLCQKCLHLHLELSYPGSSEEDSSCRDEFDDYDTDEESVVHELTCDFPSLIWMTFLKSFVFIQRESYEDLCLNELLTWIFVEQRKSGFHFEHLWIQGDFPLKNWEEDFAYRTAWKIVDPPHVKSLQTPRKIPNSAFEDDRVCSLLQNVGSIEITENLFLPDIRFIQGCVHKDIKEIREFFLAHPNLEHLLLKDLAFHKKSICSGNQEINWTLKELRTLVYIFIELDSIEEMMRACPNLEALYICWNQNDVENIYENAQIKEFRNQLELPNNSNYLKSIKFHQLTTLSLDSIHVHDGNLLESIFTSCKELRKLHLGRITGTIDWFYNLCRFLPLVTQLQDFRLLNRKNDGNCFRNVMPLLDALSECHTLERAVVIGEDYQKTTEDDSKDIREYLLQFVKRMQRLVAICIVSELRFDDSSAVNHLRESFLKEVTPSRPSLWYHFGPSFPKEIDPNIPRIHFNEIIRPSNPFNIPPKSF